MSVSTRAERRRRIFLAARTVFVGGNASIRDRSAMIKVILSNEQPFRQVIQSFTKSIVFDIVSTLLTNQVFESELKAKLAFPELYSVSAVRGLQHDTSEQNAARSEREALENIQSDEGTDHDGEEHDHKQTAVDDPKKDCQNSSPFTSPSLFPSYLSYAVQHKLLNAVQKLLEECCWDFAVKWVPTFLQDQKRDCAEAVELSHWLKVLPSRLGKLNAEATCFDSHSQLHDALVATHPIRHAAVHRLPMQGKSLELMLNNALILAEGLRDAPRTTRPQFFLGDFQARREEMELQKNNLENSLDEELKDIEAQRKALDQKEQEAKEKMIRLDTENTRDVSEHFEGSICQLWSDDNLDDVDEKISHNGEAQLDGIEDESTDTMKQGKDSEGNLEDCDPSPGIVEGEELVQENDE